VSPHEFASQQRPRLALGLLLAGVVAAGAITIVIAVSRHSLPTPAPVRHTTAPTTTPSAIAPTSSPSALPGPAISMRIVQQLSIGSRSANAITVSQGIVWVAAQGPVYGDEGRLLRIDASTARQTASWVVGGDPVAVSAAANYVWVANSFGDGSIALPSENTVMQFNAATGALVHTYRIESPAAVVANGNGALVASLQANGPTDIYRLTAGRSALVATVPGLLFGPSGSDQTAVAVCSGQVYLGVTELSPGQSIHVYALPLRGGPARPLATIQGAYWPVMTCDSNWLYVFDGAGDLPVLVNPVDGRMSTMPEGSGASAVAFESGFIWQLHNAYGPSGSLGSEGYLTALDPNTGLESSSRLTIPSTAASEVFLLAPAASGLWVVGGNEALLLHVTFG
jgi:outer membrane protein assembly factor BamB